MRVIGFLVILAALAAVGAGAWQSSTPAGDLYVTPRPTDDLYIGAAAAPLPSSSAAPRSAPAATPGPDYAATAQAANALAQVAADHTQAAAQATAGAKTALAEQTADARSAYADMLTRQAGDAAMTATRQALANTQQAATLTTAPVTQQYLLTAEAHRTQIIVDEQSRTDSRERWGWIFVAASVGLCVGLVAAGFALYDWLAGRTAVQRAEADRIRQLATEEARARRQAILMLAQANSRPAEPPAESPPPPRLPIEVAGQPLPQHPPETMHVLYVLARCLDIAGDAATTLPTSARLEAVGIWPNARQKAVGPLVAAGLLETTPGGGTRVAGRLTLRQLYDLIYACGLATPAPLEPAAA